MFKIREIKETFSEVINEIDFNNEEITEPTEMESISTKLAQYKGELMTLLDKAKRSNIIKNVYKGTSASRFLNNLTHLYGVIHENTTKY